MWARPTSGQGLLHSAPCPLPHAIFSLNAQLLHQLIEGWTARLTRFSNPRKLPGQLWLSRTRSACGVNPVILFLSSAASLCNKVLARSGISSSLLRRGKGRGDHNHAKAENRLFCAQRCIIVYTVFALKSPSGDHICIGQNKNMEFKLIFFELTTRYHKSILYGIGFAAL